MQERPSITPFLKTLSLKNDLFQIFRDFLKEKRTKTSVFSFYYMNAKDSRVSMSLKYRYILLYTWVTLLGYVLVLNLILYLNKQQIYFWHAYQQFGDASYLKQHYFFIQNMYVVILLPVFVISTLFGKIMLIFQYQDDTTKRFSLFTLATIIGVLLFIGLYIQSLFHPSIEPSKMMTIIVCPFFFIFTLYQFQLEAKK